MFRRLASILLCLLMAESLLAQYHDEGRDPFSTKWRQLNTDDIRLIYPENFGAQAGRVLRVMDSARVSLNYGFSLPPVKIPVVLHTSNLSSNGVVTWTPKRTELVTTPPVTTFAVPWLKQLSVHEYRHVVQMSNLNRNVVKYAGYLIGEQAVGAAGLLLPVWFLEGDATLAETKATSFGRALQPEFTIEYRAYLDGADVDQFPADKWFVGSYKDYIPNHYHLGYQITNMTYRRYGMDFWENITEYSTKRPYLLAPRNFAYKKYYGTSSKQMFYDAFAELKPKWDSLPPRKNTARIIETPKENYTLYSYPQFINDSVIVALKYDLSRPKRIVAINTRTGSEKLLAFTGAVSSRPIYCEGELFWTEYRAGTFWEQKNYSVVCRIPLNEEFLTAGAKKTYRSAGNIFFVTPYGSGFAALEYGDGGVYFLKFFDAEFNTVDSFPLPDNLTFHGMAWDKQTDLLALIALSEDGMFLARADMQSRALTNLTPPSFVTINHLSAGSGRLVFNSISTGADEIHVYDIDSEREYLITESAYGSIMPSVSPDGLMSSQVTYRRDGYFVSTSALTDTIREIAYRKLPENIFNTPLPEFGMTNIDSLKIYDDAEDELLASKKYRKIPHLLNFHSWAPVSFDPFELADDTEFEPEVGITVMSQNVLANTMGYLTYGRRDGRNLFKGEILFKLFAPEIRVGFEYGGRERNIYAYTPWGSIIDPPYYKRGKDYFSADLEVSLPMNLGSGYVIRTLTPVVSLKHYNSLVYDYRKNSFYHGYQQLETGLTFSQYTRLGYRDISPRWGSILRLTMAGSPFSKHFGTIYSAFGTAYTPGFAVNHSLRIRGSIQYQDKDVYNYKNSAWLPRGVNYNFIPYRLWSVLGDYTLPLAYPDGGISGLIYVKRIYATVFGGYARYKAVSLGSAEYHSLTSYGAELVFNMSPLRMSNANVDLKISGYKPSDSRNPGFSIGISVSR